MTIVNTHVILKCTLSKKNNDQFCIFLKNECAPFFTELVLGFQAVRH